MSPSDAGVVIDRIKTSLSVMPTKLFDASVLYPHVLVSNTSGIALADAGSSAPRLFMSVLSSARIYNLKPITSVEVTVTVLVPVACAPPVAGVTGMTTLPLVAIEREVSSPYGTSASYKPAPYGWALLL